MRASSKVIGAFVVGVILVAGSLCFSNLHAKNQQAIADARVGVVTAEAPKRQPIEVTDSDGDTIPDWKEGLRAAEPIQVNAPEQTEVYERPDTLTGAVGVDMLKEVLESKYKGSLGKTQEEILTEAESRIGQAATDELYYEKHITIDSNTDTDALRAYGNKVAEIAYMYEKPAYIEHELAWLQKAVETNDEEMLKDLDPIVASLKKMTEAMLATPVPETMVKEHLDLTNTYNALYIDTDAIQKVFSDPMYSAVRVRRYGDDAIGLHHALTNLYTKLVLNGVSWEEGEPAAALVEIQ